MPLDVTSIENGDFTGERVVCLVVLRNKIGDGDERKVSYAIWKEATNS